MPSKYTKDTLPRPLNPDVHIKEMPSRTMAALTWNGRSPREPQARCAGAPGHCLCTAASQPACGPWPLPELELSFSFPEMQVEEKKAELLKLLREAGLKPVGSVHVWQYVSLGLGAELCPCQRCPRPPHPCALPAHTHLTHRPPCPSLRAQHPPFAPSWQRVNEVLLQLEGGQLEEQPLAAAK
jgi:hypothetical protein